MLLCALCCLRVWAYSAGWWMALKYPHMAHFQVAHSDRPTIEDLVRGYVDDVRSPLMMFLKRYQEHVYFKVNGVLAWDDQEDEPDVLATSLNAHSKGILLVDENGGTLLTHSSRKFPPKGRIWDFNVGRDDQPVEHFFCVNLTRLQVNKFLDEVLTKIHPAVQEKFLSPNLATMYPTLMDIVDRPESVWKTGSEFTRVDFFLPNTATLSMVVKPRDKVGSIFEHIATQVVNGTILAQTWIRSRDGYERPTRYVRDVCELKGTWYQTWCTTLDHSKFFVVESGDFVGVGDLDRHRSQWSRGGIFFLLSNPELAQSFRSRVLLYNKTCAEENHTCSDDRERDPNKDNTICASETCKCTDDNCCKPNEGTSIPASACAPVSSSCEIEGNGTHRSGICVDSPRGGECAIEGIWSDWYGVGDCSVPCGGGTKIRMRYCTGICRGDDSKTEECNMVNCNDCALTRANDFDLLGTDALHVWWCNGAGKCGSYDSLTAGWCRGCPPSADNNFTCMNDEQCATSDCCRSRGGISRCPADQPFMCEWKVCGASPDYCCVPTPARCADKGGVLRSCPFCVDKFAGHIQCGDTCNVRATRALCPRTCDLCSCSDNDAGLQTEPYMGCYTCDYAKYHCSSDAVQTHCPRTCNVCGSYQDRDELRLKGNMVEKCPAMGSSCAKVSSLRTPCAVAVDIEELHSIGGWNDKIDTVWVHDGCVLRLYEHVEYGGKSAEFRAGTHRLASLAGMASSIKCECDFCGPELRNGPPVYCPQVCNKVRISDISLTIRGGSILNSYCKFYVNGQVKEEVRYKKHEKFNRVPSWEGTYEVHHSGDPILVVCADSKDGVDDFLGQNTFNPASFRPAGFWQNFFGGRKTLSSLPRNIRDNYTADSGAHSNTRLTFTFVCIPPPVTPCPVNHYVWNHRCYRCPSDTTRPAGDDASGEDTRCIATSCQDLDMEACLVSKDWRAVYENSPCTWCCAGACGSGSEKCEALSVMQRTSHWGQQGTVAENIMSTCPKRESYLRLIGPAFTIYGKLCGGECEKGGKDYLWCDIGGSWDYCAMGGYTRYGEMCRDVCARKGEDYYWCTDSSSWEYCSPDRWSLIQG